MLYSYNYKKSKANDTNHYFNKVLYIINID